MNNIVKMSCQQLLVISPKISRISLFLRKFQAILVHRLKLGKYLINRKLISWIKNNKVQETRLAFPAIKKRISLIKQNQI